MPIFNVEEFEPEKHESDYLRLLAQREILFDKELMKAVLGICGERLTETQKGLIEKIRSLDDLHNVVVWPESLIAGDIVNVKIHAQINPSYSSLDEQTRYLSEKLQRPIESAELPDGNKYFLFKIPPPEEDFSGNVGLILETYKEYRNIHRFLSNLKF